MKEEGIKGKKKKVVWEEGEAWKIKKVESQISQHSDRLTEADKQLTKQNARWLTELIALYCTVKEIKQSNLLILLLVGTKLIKRCHTHMILAQYKNSKEQIRQNNLSQK